MKPLVLTISLAVPPCVFIAADENNADNRYAMQSGTLDYYTSLNETSSGSEFCWK